MMCTKTNLSKAWYGTTNKCITIQNISRITNFFCRIACFLTSFFYLRFSPYRKTPLYHKVYFREYVQVGKGRDVGMLQIYKFEAKLSQGAAEQTLSRDVNRLGDRLDFFRLMSFYFGGLGYYMGNFITVLTVTFAVYFTLALAIFDEEAIGDRKVIPEGNLQVTHQGLRDTREGC